MEIRYTSINDVYANYVFQFEDNLEGIKRINDFAIKDIVESKQVKDSIFEKMSLMSKKESIQYLQNQSLPTSAENLKFYKAPTNLDGEPDNESLILEYELDENNFKIKDILLPENQFKNRDLKFIIKSRTQSECTINLEIKKKEFELQYLNLLYKEIKKLNFHNANQIFVYKIKDSSGENILLINFENNGKYFKLNFDEKM